MRKFEPHLLFTSCWCHKRRQTSVGQRQGGKTISSGAFLARQLNKKVVSWPKVISTGKAVAIPVISVPAMFTNGIWTEKKKNHHQVPAAPFLSGAAQSVSLGFEPCAVPLQRFKTNKHEIKNETKARVAWLVQGGALGGILGCFFCHHLSNRSNLPYIWGSRSGNSTFDAHFYPCGTAAGCWYGKTVEEKNPWLLSEEIQARTFVPPGIIFI